MNFARRDLLVTISTALLTGLSRARAQEPSSVPVVSEDACPLTPFAPVADDGFRGAGILRKPPGDGPFPAVLWIHGDMVTYPLDTLRGIARSPSASRFLAAGYVVFVPTYRSRDHDPQSGVSLADCLAVIRYARTLPYVDSKSIVVYGCSGGGDLALQAASATEVAGVVSEEPATVMMSGVFNTSVPKRGERYTLPIPRPLLRIRSATTRRNTNDRFARSFLESSVRSC